MVQPFSFVHAADLHLGTPFSGILKADPGTGRMLRDATLKAFENLVDFTIREKASFLLLAGDVYDGPERSLKTLSAFISGIKKLGEHGIEVFVSAGNHDPGDSRAYALMGEPPENLRIFPAKPSHAEVVRNGEILAVVHGMSYPKKAVTENLAARFRRLRPDGFEIGLLHATLSGHKSEEPYAPTDMETLKASGLDYWALGHVHTRWIKDGGTPAAAYPGNLQALSPRETGARGALKVSVSADGSVEAVFHELDAVRFATLEIDLADVSDGAALPGLLNAAGMSAAALSGGRALVITALLKGKTPLHREISRAGELEELTASLRSEFEGSRPALWWNALKNETSPPLDLHMLAARGGLEAEIIRTAERLAGNPEELKELAAGLFSDLTGKREYEKLLGPPPEGGELEDLLASSLNLALGLLDGGDR